MSIRFFTLLCAILLAPHIGLAQTKSAPQKPAGVAKPAAGAPAPAQTPDPQITTTAFGDWALRCQKISDGQKNCEVSLTIQEKDQPAPIAKIALGRPAPGGPLHLLVLLPNNVSFPSSVQIKSDDKDMWSLDIPWQRCVPGACFAETLLKDADLVRWRVLDGAGKLTFKDAQGNEIGIPFAYAGLSQALNALEQ